MHRRRHFDFLPRQAEFLDCPLRNAAISVDIITVMSTPERVSEHAHAAHLRAPALTQRSTPQVDQLFATLVDAAFDLIDEIGTISLCTYLHVPHTDQPLLFVRTPLLETLSPTDNFRLMHTITMLSNGRKPVAAFRHGALSGHYVRTTGETSDGLFVFGDIQDAETAKRLTGVCRAFARVLHQFHLDDGVSPLDPPLLDLEQHDDLSKVSVTFEHDSRTLQGTAVALSPEEAVSKAVIIAMGQGHRFDKVQTIDVGTRSAVLVVAHDPNGALRLGLAISDGDVLQTTAVAAKRALVDITPH